MTIKRPPQDPPPPSAGPVGRPQLSLVQPGAKPRPLTPRQEQFAVDVAAGMSTRDAFMKNYTWNGSDNGMSVEIRRLLSNPRLAARLQALRDTYAQRVIEASRGKPSESPAQAYGVKEAMDELDKGMTLALSKENPAAVAKIVEVKMKLYGLGISDQKNPNDKPAMEPEQIEELLAKLRAWKAAKHG